MKKSNISKQEELAMNRIMNKWEKVESKLYIAGVLGWINVVVREEIHSLLALQRKSIKREVEEKVIGKSDYDSSAYISLEQDRASRNRLKVEQRKLLSKLV